MHALRKTALTNALENGAPIQKVQQLAGHADIRTTQLYYRPSSKDKETRPGTSEIRNPDTAYSSGPDAVRS